MEKSNQTLVTCSVIVVTYNEERNIEECLRSLIDQDYPDEMYEILVVDGCSDDKTQEIVRHISASVSLPKIRLLTNQKRTIASNRNVGLQASQSDFVAFTDADCICPSSWLTNLVKGFQNSSNPEKLVGVGGGNQSQQNFGRVSDAIGLAFQSYFSGLGTVQTTGPEKIKEVESLACLNVFYHRKTVLDVGGFNEQLGNMCEDWELNFRLRQQGYKLLFIPKNHVIHKMRFNWSQFVDQMYRYGKGRTSLMRANIDTISLKYLLPLGFVLGMVSFEVLGFVVDPIYHWIPLLYLFFIALVSFNLCYAAKRLILWKSVFVAFVVIHFGYGIGEWAGLIKVRFK